jgi:hypothetical protein
VVDVDDVDRVDGGIGVGIRREQRAPGVGEEVHRLFEELDPGHVGHAVVGEEHGHQVAAQLQLPQRVERLRPRLRAHDAVALAVLPAKVPGDRPRHPRVVVDGQEDRFAVGFGSRHVEATLLMALLFTGVSSSSRPGAR